MDSKTPKFNKALEKYFSELELDEQGGQERVCRFSGKKFYITAEDIEFYQKIGVPLPTLSPHESTRSKLAWINLYHLFFNESSKTRKKIISSYPENTKYKIWEHQIWSDYDFTNLGVEYNAKETFFEQYSKFQLKIPRPNLIARNNVNSEYVHVATNVKNCYFIFDTDSAEDSQFCGYINDSKKCYHCYAVVKSQICYEDSNCTNLWKCFFTEFSENCLNSSFLFDCRDCSNCFMCTNLRHKKYYFYNQKLSKEEYQEKIKEINLGSRKIIEKLKKDFKEIKETAVHRANHNEKNVNCLGDFINNSKNCHHGQYIEKSENLSYVLGAFDSRDCRDSAVCLESELIYNSVLWGTNCYNVKFSAKGRNLQDSEYCDFCSNSSNCFACIGLKNKKFCIFNKQYTEERYWQKIDEIKTKMLKDGEYGEFFPPKLHPIPYQISSGASFGGYDDIEVAKKYGYDTKEIPEVIQQTENEIPIDTVVDDIKNVQDNILQKVIIDKNGKKFRYTKEELDFHREHKLVLPVEHYSVSLARKRISLGPIDFDLKYRNCTKCGEKAQVTFPKEHPDAPIKIYCEKCYNKEVA